MTKNPPLIQLKNICKKYALGDGEFYQALNGVSLDISSGEFVAIMGPSGSGKSTTMHIIGALDIPTSGTYLLKGKDISSYTADQLAEIRNKEIGFVFQSFNLLPRTTVLKNVERPMVYAGIPQDERTKRALAALDLVHIADKAQNLSNRISGGQIQRVAIARALVMNPSIILADEPTGNLDTKTSSEIMEFLQTLNKKGNTVIVITHEPDIAAFAKRVIRIVDGKIVSDTKKITMQYKEIIKSAFQALRGNILRTSLTMIGIIIGITSVILIYSIGQGAVAFITNELSSFGIDYFQINPGKSQFSSLAGSDTLTFEDLEAIENDSSLTNIKYVAPIAMASKVVSANNEEDEFLIYGVTPEMLEILRPEVTEGEFITEEQEISSERIIILGSEASEKLFGENASPLGETVRITNKSFQVTGVVESSSVLAGGFINNAVFIPINVVTNEILGEEKLQEIDISVHDAKTINQTIDDVEALLRERHDLAEDDDNDFQIQSAQDMLSTVQTITGLLTAMVAAISGISLIVGGVGVMNIMLVSVTERTKEIGLLKAIGAKEKDILTQFLMEAIVMTLTGGIIGIILGVLGAYAVSLAFGIPFVVSIPAIIVAVGVSTLVGVVFGLYPARRAARLSPIDALRYE